MQLPWLSFGHLHIPPLASTPSDSFLVAWLVDNADVPINLNMGCIRLSHCRACSAVIRRCYREARSAVGGHARKFFVCFGEVFSDLQAFSCVTDSYALHQKCSICGGLIRSFNSGHCMLEWSFMRTGCWFDQSVTATIGLCVDIGECGGGALFVSLLW